MSSQDHMDLDDEPNSRVQSEMPFGEGIGRQLSPCGEESLVRSDPASSGEATGAEGPADGRQRSAQTHSVNRQTPSFVESNEAPILKSTESLEVLRWVDKYKLYLLRK